MIETRELMLGNYIEYGQGEYSQIVRLHQIEAGYLDTHNVIDKFYGENKWFFPIPLTEEWLLKFDFVKTDSSIKRHDVPTFNNRSHQVFLEYHLGGWYMTTPHIVKEIQYVHQFQNLHYAVTLEELDIK